jgi:hypothetical protein
MKQILSELRFQNMSKHSSKPRLIDQSIIRARCANELKTRVIEFTEANNLQESDLVREAVEFYLDHIEQGGQRRLVNPFSKKKR